MPNTIDTQSLPVATLLTFTWYDQTRRYTNWNSDVVDGAETFTANPGIEIMYPTFDGGVKESPLTFRSPERVGDPQSGPPLEPIVWMVGRPFAAVGVRIEEMDPSDPTSRRTTFRGTILYVTRNDGGRSGIYRVAVQSAKGSLDIPLGLQLLPTCPWTLGDQITCKVVLSAYIETGTITAINGTTVTIDGLDDHDADPGYWRGGDLYIDGLYISVRDWQGGTTFVLTRVPPDDWLNRDVDVTPGCDKRVETCRNRYDAEENYAGIASEMPDTNAVTEGV